jgi:hypothetical protein
MSTAYRTKIGMKLILKDLAPARIPVLLFASTNKGNWCIYGKPEFITALRSYGGSSFKPLYGALLVCCKFFDETKVLNENVPQIKLDSSETKNIIPLGKCLITEDYSRNYIGEIFVDNEKSAIVIKLEEGGDYKNVNDFYIELPDKYKKEEIPEIVKIEIPVISQRELNRNKRLHNINSDRLYWSNPKYKTYKFPAISWKMDMERYGVLIDEDILGLEYQCDNGGNHVDKILDLLLRLELKPSLLAKLFKYYDVSKYSISEIIEDFLTKVLSYGDIDGFVGKEIIQRTDTAFGFEFTKKYPDTPKIDIDIEEHVTDLSEIKVEIKKT